MPVPTRAVVRAGLQLLLLLRLLMSLLLMELGRRVDGENDGVHVVHHGG
jgi:hypothetical protein